MLLYDIYYFGAGMDSDSRLPEPSGDIRYAVTKNGTLEYLVPQHGKWVSVTQQEALQRNSSD